MNEQQAEEQGVEILPVTVNFEEGDPSAMYLRTVWATGKTDSGKEFEVAQSGVTVIFTLGNFDDGGERRVWEMPIRSLVGGWIEAIGES